MNQYAYQNFKIAFCGLFLLLFCSSCGYDSYLVASSDASYQELFVAAHALLKLHYEFEIVDKESGILETNWLVVPNVDSFGSERHKIRVQIIEDPETSGGLVYVRVEIESREPDPLTRGVPGWVPYGRDPEKEEAILKNILNSVW